MLAVQLAFYQYSAKIPIYACQGRTDLKGEAGSTTLYFRDSLSQYFIVAGFSGVEYLFHRSFLSAKFGRRKETAARLQGLQCRISCKACRLFSARPQKMRNFVE
jgi:hypothetical protein